MKFCPITYQEILEGKYSQNGLHQLSKKLNSLKDIPYSADEQRIEAVARAGKMSIQGVQPKLSAKLDVKNQSFKIVDTKGEYILKPQSHLYPELPQNEDLSMRLASIAGVEIPLHGLVFSKDGSLTYFIKRFDRKGKKKFAVEDFAQLLGHTRDTKYDSSMEQVSGVIEKYCTFPVIEKVKLFRLSLINYLLGNEDMHLKNFSLIRHGNKIELSPAYDIINTTIALKNPVEELALPLAGKKNNLSRKIFLEYFGVERLSLTQKAVDQVTKQILNSFSLWDDFINRSFLSDKMKDLYKDVIKKRRKVLQF